MSLRQNESSSFTDCLLYRLGKRFTSPSTQKLPENKSSVARSGLRGAKKKPSTTSLLISKLFKCIGNFHANT